MNAEKEKTHWFVYMVRCADETLYTGITTDVQRRIEEHNGNSGNTAGARYTRARKPVMLVYKEQVDSRSIASKREIAIKKMKKQKKEALLNV